MRIASASSLQGMATSTGPKISSRARRQSLATFAKMVGIGADNAERLTPRVAQNMLAEGDRFALEFAAQAAKVTDDVDCGLCLRTSLGAKRVPGLERNRARQLLDPCLERIGDPCEQAPTLAWDRARPGGKGIGRGWHGARDVLSVPPGNLSDRAPVRRVLDLKHLARSAINPPPADQHARF